MFIQHNSVFYVLPILMFGAVCLGTMTGLVAYSAVAKLRATGLFEAESQGGGAAKEALEERP